MWTRLLEYPPEAEIIDAVKPLLRAANAATAKLQTARERFDADESAMRSDVAQALAAARGDASAIPAALGRRQADLRNRRLTLLLQEIEIRQGPVAAYLTARQTTLQTQATICRNHARSAAHVAKTSLEQNGFTGTPRDLERMAGTHSDVQSWATTADTLSRKLADDSWARANSEALAQVRIQLEPLQGTHFSRAHTSRAAAPLFPGKQQKTGVANG